MGRYEFTAAETGLTFLIDDEPLVAGPQALWLWQPGFYAGEVTADLRSRDGRSVLFLLDVAPEPGKVGRDIFRQMVDDIVAVDPDLVFGTEPATTPIGDLGGNENTWLAFARLRRYGPEFLRAASGIVDRPRRALRAKRDRISMMRARRVDRHTAVSLSRRPAPVFASGRAPLAADVSDSELRLDVPAVEETLDAPANRALFALLVALQRRCRSVRERLEKDVLRELLSETTTALAPRWEVRKKFLDDFNASLARLERRRPFSSVRGPELSAAGLTAIAADPVYARAWNRGWRALRRGLEGERGEERLWISPSWQIYERWCFVRLATTLQASAPEWQWRRMAYDRWVGSHGNRSAELVLQPTFRSQPHSSGERLSVSKQREPDIVVSVTAAGGTRFVVLDAKYRVSTPHVLDAMSSAHIYQDSLRMRDGRPEASLLLVPAAGGAPWLEDASFQATHRVGIHPFSPSGKAVLPVPVVSLLVWDQTQ